MGGKKIIASLRRRPLYALFVVVALIVAAWGFRPRPIQVDTTRVRRETVEVAFTEEGRTRLRERFVVAAPLTGILERIELEPGDPVEAGAHVAVIRAARAALLDAASREEARARWQASIDESRVASAALQAARARERDRRLALERLTHLAQGELVARGEVDAVRAEVEVARADVAAAAARVGAAHSQERAAASVLALQGRAGEGPIRVEVEAPAGGRVIRRSAESETVVNAGQPLLEIGDLRDLEVVVDALTSDAVRVAPGTSVELRNWGGDAVLPARVQRVEPGAFVKVSALGVEEQRVPVVARLLGAAPSALGDGFRVDARFIVWRGDALAIPVAALVRDNERWAVYTVEDGRARLRRIVLGHVGETRAEVRSGVRENAEVVLYPGDRLRDGVRVAATSAGVAE